METSRESFHGQHLQRGVKLLHRRIFSFLFLLTLLVSWTGPSSAGFFDGKQKFYTLKTEHFYIHYPDGIGPIAEDMKTITEEAYANIVGRLHWRPWGRTHVILTDKTDQANGMAAVVPYNYILVYIAPPDADSSLDHYRDYLRLLFNHELTHIVHIDMHYRLASPARFLFGRVVAPNGATPSWMREGMAVYEESKLDEGFGRNNSDYTEMVLRTAAYENRFPRIDQIAGLSQHFPGGTGPYQFGGVFFDWMAQKYGEDRMYKYQKEYASSLWVFSLNNKARHVYSKSFYKLWDEFKADLTQKYEAQKQSITALGLTALTPVIENKDSQRYYTPSPAGNGFAYFESGFDDASRIVIQPDEGAPQQEIKRKLFGQMSFSKTGRYLAFASLASVEKKTSRSEVYYYDTKDKKLFRVYDQDHTKLSMRAMDPDFSSTDGGQRWLVMVRNFLNTDQLYLYDLYERKGYVITNEPKNTQLAQPRFSPDGQSIVVSRKDPVTGFRDIVVYSNKGEKLFDVTHDIHSDEHPVFSQNGQSIYFDSSRTGVPNIYEFSLKQKTLAQLTNVLDGVFQPMQATGSGDIFVQRYASEKTSIQKFNRSAALSQALSVSVVDAKKQISTQSNVVFSTRHYAYVKTANGVLGQLEKHENFDNESTDVVPDDASVGTSKNANPKSDSDHWNGLSKDSIAAQISAFSKSPDMPELLPDALYGNIATLGKNDGAEDEDKDENIEDDQTKAVQSKTVEKKDFPSPYKDALQNFPPEAETDRTNPPDAKKYHAFPQVLVPRYLVPSLLFYESAALVGAVIGRNDPLFRHNWTAFANYQSGAAFVGGGGTYVYSRYDPIFYIGGLRYSVDWGDVNGTRFYEERHRAYGGASFVLAKRHKFNISYFYEQRNALTNLSVNLINMKPYAGFQFQYNLSNYKKYADSISQENGYSIKIAGDWTNTLLGSDDVNEERAVQADLRYYFEMPWSDHHVLALRVAGGWAWGDVQQFGVYRLGGPFGEGVGAGYSSRLFPLRGLPGITFGGDGAFIFSAEYRLPLVNNINRGVGTWPIFLDKLSLNFFTDGGDIKYRTELPDLFTRMLVSVGAELEGDLVIGYGLPINVRGGYGIILTNVDRLGSLTDATTGASLKYGSVYLQLGTMF